MSLPTRRQSAEDIRSYVSRMLGQGVIDVELKVEHLDEAVQDAIYWYQATVGQRTSFSLDLLQGKTVYDVPSNMETLVSMDFEIETFNGEYDWFEAGYWQYRNGYQSGYGYNRSPLSEQTYHNVYWEQMRQVFDQEPEYEFDRDRRLLIISPVPKMTLKARVYYLRNTADLSYMQIKEYRLVRKYALAVAKGILGQIRGKYNDLPSAAGSITLNGGELVSQAEREIEQLDEEMGKYRKPIPFITG